MKTQDSGSNIDLYGANVKLWIENNGEMVPFKNIVGAATDYIESINIRIGLMEIFQVEIKLSPPLSETEKMLNSGKIGLGFTATTSNSTKKAKSVGDESNKQDKEYHLNKMAVQLDYGGLKSPVFKAILLMPEINISESGIDVTIKGVGMLFEQTKKTVLIEDGVSDYEAIVKLLSANNSIKLEFDKKSEESLKSKKHEAGRTGKAFEQAKEILSRHGCKMYYKGALKSGGRQTVEIVHTELMRENKNNMFVAFRDINPNKRVFPILSMSAPVSNIVASGVVLGIKNATFDKSSKEIKDQDANGKSFVNERANKVTSQDGSLPGGAGSSLKNKDGESSGFDNDDIVGNLMGSISKDGNIIDNIKAVAHDWMEKVFKYEVTSVLIPDLLPARMATIKIADIKALSNSYDITTVEHNVSQGGLETIIHCAGTGGMASLIGQGGNKVGVMTVNATSSLVKKVRKVPKPVDIE